MWASQRIGKCKSRYGDETIVIQKEMQCKINLNTYPFTGNVSPCAPANTVQSKTKQAKGWRSALKRNGRKEAVTGKSDHGQRSSCRLSAVTADLDISHRIGSLGVFVGEQV